MWDGAAASPIIDGTGATLQLFTNSGESYSVPAIIKSFELTVDINDGMANRFTAEFVGNGAWTEPTLS